MATLEQIKEAEAKKREEEKQELERRIRFAEEWINASSPAKPERQAQILLEYFSRTNHSHPLPIKDMVFG